MIVFQTLHCPVSCFQHPPSYCTPTLRPHLQLVRSILSCSNLHLLIFYSVSPTHSLWLNSFLHQPFPGWIHFIKGTVAVSEWKLHIEFVAIAQEVWEDPRLMWCPGVFSSSSATLSILGMMCLMLTIWLPQLQPSHGDTAPAITWRHDHI